MSIWTTIVSKMRELRRTMTGNTTIEQQLNLSYAISPQMKNAIEKWSAMYRGESPWLHEPTLEDPTHIASLNLASMIASEKARTATIEMEIKITGESERAKYLEEQLEEAVANEDYEKAASIRDEIEKEKKN